MTLAALCRTYLLLMDFVSHSTGSAEPTSAIQFPTVDARTWTLPNGLGIIVQEDHSAPVASVQVWIETGSIHEDRHLGAGLSRRRRHDAWLRRRGQRGVRGGGADDPVAA